jgi:putative SOS response-associated peptidase YedK
MCGRFTLTTPAAEWAALFELDSIPEFEPRYNIAPTQIVAAVRSRYRAQHSEESAEAAPERGSSREFAGLRWGLVPHWAKEPDLKGRTLINARSETVSERPSFRDSFRFRRCLVVADGFYEWQPAGARKQPYWIHLDTEAPFGFAGLWDAWSDGTETLESCTILTTDANELLQPIHDRMPVIIDPADYDAWIHPETAAWDLERMLVPWPSDSLRLRPVSTHVNYVGNDDPECIAPRRSQTDLFG